VRPKENQLGPPSGSCAGRATRPRTAVATPSVLVAAGRSALAAPPRPGSAATAGGARFAAFLSGATTPGSRLQEHGEDPLLSGQHV